MTQLKYRQAAYEKAREDRIIRRIARHKAAKKSGALICANGRVNIRKTVVAQCEGCPAVFEFVMTTKPHRFCPACKVQRQQERDRDRPRG